MANSRSDSDNLISTIPDTSRPGNVSSDLPPEIWSHIFDMLELRWRKNIKLVSRTWYDIVTIISLRKERIVCRHFSVVREILPDLARLKCRLKYLEFQSLRFNSRKYDLQFWMARGPQIEELRFRSCTMDDITFMHIVRHCTNLRHLYWNDTSKPLCTYKALDTLISDGTERASLVSLDTCVIDDVRVLLGLQTIFPNVKNISFFFRNGQFDANVQELYEKFNKPCDLRRKLSLRDFNSCTKPFLEKTFAFMFHDLESLQEIEIAANMNTLPTCELLAIISRQNRLKKFTFLDLSMHYDGPSDFYNELFETLLENGRRALHSLHLEFKGTSAININANLFVTLVSSELRYLYLGCRTIKFIDIEDAYFRIENHTLKFLYLRCHEWFPSHLGERTILNVFRNLKHLTWFAGEITIGQLLAQHYNHLQSLTLEYNASPVDLFSLATLKNLKFLSAKFREENILNSTTVQEGSDSFSKACENFLSKEFTLPNLEYLDMNTFSTEKFDTALLLAFRRSEKLKAIKWRSWTYQNLGSWMKMSSSLKNLQYLELCARNAFDLGDRELLFRKYPSLCFFIQMENRAPVFYYYDSTDKIIFHTSKLDDDKLYFPYLNLTHYPFHRVG